MMTASARMRAEESSIITCGWGREGQRRGKEIGKEGRREEEGKEKGRRER